MPEARTAALLQSLAPLPVETVTAVMRNPRSEAERTFRGTSLLRYAVLTGLVTDEQVQETLVSGYFLVTAEDGARVTVSMMEARAHGDRRVILATEQDGEPMESGARLVVPDYPGLAGRSLGRVAQVEFRDAVSREHSDAIAGTTVDLRGLLDTPGPVDVTAFDAAEMREVETPEVGGHGGARVAPRHYAGVPVYRLLERAGIRLDPDVHEDFLNKVVVATGTGGYTAAIAGGEIEPRFRDGPIIVATQRDGAPLTDEGPARLVVASDSGPGRWIRNLVSLELRVG